MAFVNGEWLARPEREEMIEALEKRALLLKEVYEAGEATQSQIETLTSDIEEIERLRRINRAEHDVLYFAIEYFSDDANPGNEDNLIPEGVDYENSAAFHKELCSLLNNVSQGEKSKHIAWACPRGSAKTSYLSKIFLCHQLVFRHKKYMMSVSQTIEMAGTFLQWTRSALKFNKKLINDFGQLLYEKSSKNEIDNRLQFITLTGAKVEAKGLGTFMRGSTWKSARVELAFLDDIESLDSTSTGDQVNKSLEWFKADLLPALSKDGTCIYMGTLIAENSLLNYVLKDRKDFEKRKFAAIEQWPTNSELWDKWQAIYLADDEDSDEKAMEFYQKHKAEMDEGAELLWPERWSLYDLQVIRANSGDRAFASEYQNETRSAETQIFKPEDFFYFTEDELEGKNLEYYAGIDLAMGKNGKRKGDFSAIITVAKNRDTGVCYVVDTFIERVHPDELTKEIVDHAMYYQYTGIAIEKNAFQEFYTDVVDRELERVGYPAHTRVKKITNKSRKELRIESLLPHIQAGKIRFRKDQRRLLYQFEFYGSGAPHDDGPDATHGAWNIASSALGEIRMSRKKMR